MPFRSILAQNVLKWRRHIPYNFIWEVDDAPK